MKLITKILPVSCLVPNWIIWHFSKKEDSTVKSGYRLMADLAGDFANGVVHGDWKALWNIKLLPKAKHCL